MVCTKAPDPLYHYFFFSHKKVYNSYCVLCRKSNKRPGREPESYWHERDLIKTVRCVISRHVGGRPNSCLIRTDRPQYCCITGASCHSNDLLSGYIWYDVGGHGTPDSDPQHCHCDHQPLRHVTHVCHYTRKYDKVIIQICTNEQSWACSNAPQRLQ